MVEVLVTMTIAAIVSLTAYTIFSTLFNQYFGLQADGSEFTNLATQSQRIANVLRGTTDIVSASDNDLTAYAYFSPNDTYVSQIHYYLNASSTALLADVTPMSANPPTGTPIPAQMRSYTIIPSYHQLTGLNLFEYINSTNNTLATPVSDENAIKSIKINLSVPADHPTPNGNQQISLQVDLRNRKTNL